MNSRFASPTPVWLRLPQTKAYYATREQERRTAAMTAALPYLGSQGFTGIEHVAFVDMATTGAVGGSGDFQSPDGKTLKGYLHVRPSLNAPSMAHETLHSFGLPDLYSTTPTPIYYTNHYDVMADSQRPTAAPLAWQQWALQWLAPSQVRCWPGAGPLTTTLTPIESASTTARKAVMVPINTHKMLVVEARSTVVGSAGCTDGVVISIVDSAVGTASGPIRVQSPTTGNCPTLNGDKSAAWPAGSSYTEPESGTLISIGSKAANGTWSIAVQPLAGYAQTVLDTASLVAYWRLGDKDNVQWYANQGPLVADGRIHNAQGKSALAGFISDPNMLSAGKFDQPGAPAGTTDTSQGFEGTRWIDVPLAYYGAQGSMELWTKAASDATSAYVFGSDSGFKLVVGPGSASLRATRGGTSVTQVSAVTPDNRNVWVHWAAVADATTLRLYRNGAQVGSQTLTGSGGIAQGAGQIGALNGGAPRFRGLIDDVSVYSSALSASDVSTHYQRGINP